MISGLLVFKKPRFGEGKDFLNKTQKALTIIKRWIDWTVLKINDSYSSKDTTQRIKRQATDGEKTVIPTSTKDSLPEYIKKS